MSVITISGWPDSAYQTMEDIFSVLTCMEDGSALRMADISVGESLCM